MQEYDNESLTNCNQPKMKSNPCPGRSPLETNQTVNGYQGLGSKRYMIRSSRADFASCGTIDGYTRLFYKAFRKVIYLFLHDFFPLFFGSFLCTWKVFHKSIILAAAYCVREY